MSEAMTSESIIEAEWILKNYWTRVRFAFQTEHGAWSDVDVLAYRPETKHLVVAESKVKGLCEDGVVFSSFRRMVKRITVQLVCNYIVSEEIRESTKEEVLRAKGAKKLPAPMNLELDTTIDVLGRIVQLERQSGKGRRYGHPILDVARELNRYFSPTIYGRRELGRDTELFKKELVSGFPSSIEHSR